MEAQTANFRDRLDYLVLSVTEESPTFMLEAMACGTQVIATAMGAMPNIIGGSETGFIMETILRTASPKISSGL